MSWRPGMLVGSTRPTRTRFSMCLRAVNCRRVQEQFGLGEPPHHPDRMSWYRTKEQIAITRRPSRVVASCLGRTSSFAAAVGIA